MTGGNRVCDATDTGKPVPSRRYHKSRTELLSPTTKKPLPFPLLQQRTGRGGCQCEITQMLGKKEWGTKTQREPDNHSNTGATSEECVVSRPLPLPFSRQLCIICRLICTVTVSISAPRSSDAFWGASGGLSGFLFKAGHLCFASVMDIRNVSLCLRPRSDMEAFRAEPFHWAATIYDRDDRGKNVIVAMPY